MASPCVVRWDGTEDKDPLYDIADSGFTDLPVQLLAAIAKMVKENTDPWN